jgi:hypothetical protein
VRLIDHQNSQYCSMLQLTCYETARCRQRCSPACLFGYNKDNLFRPGRDYQHLVVQ